MWKQIWDKILKFVLKILGHAISGAGVEIGRAHV